MDKRDVILDFMKLKGPVLPIQIAKLVNTNLLFASAMLSELSSKGKIKISRLKIGSSPLYYLSEHKNMLEQYFDKLDEKEQRAFNLLKENLILRDSSLDALTRVCLREIKDFAVPLQVSTNGSTILFWKWHSLSDADAETKIKNVLNFASEQKKAQELERQEQIKRQEEIRKQEELKRIRKIEEEKKAQEEKQKQILELQRQEEEQRRQAQLLAEQKQEDARQLRRLKQLEEEKRRRDKLLEEQMQVAEEKKRLEFERRQLEELKRSQTKQSTQTSPPIIKNKELTKPVKKEKFIDTTGDKFFQQIESFFKTNKIRILEKECVKKESEFSFIISMDTPLGTLTCFLNAKNKKRLSDGDFSTAYIKGQSRKLPVVLLSPGKPTKKAQELLAKELKGMLFKEL